MRLTHFMMLAVEFHYESRLEAAEVGDEWAERMLAAEFKVAELPGAQMRP
ncbi:MAG TPA: hypothetical protein VMV27_03735 [Candidatus Binataceae bacterium]|nr:hypothetical protein [Candidatus Binataceae bacterium]